MYPPRAPGATLRVPDGGGGRPGMVQCRHRPPKEVSMSLRLTSSAFVNGGPIPSQYTCDAAHASPPLAWTGVPQGAKSLALIVDDPDAPDPDHPKRTWVHWVLYNLPPANGSLPTGVTPDQLPAGAIQGTNDWPRVGYGGPCPPIGRHRYF